MFWNSSPEVLKLLSKLGCSHFRCRNRDEVRAALEAGIRPDSISFVPAASPALASHLKFSKANGVQEFGFESENDLTKISLKAPNAKVLLVLRPCANVLSREEVIDLMSLAKSLELDVVGVAIREEEEDVAFLCKAISLAKTAFDVGRQEGHCNMDTLDLGAIAEVTPEVSTVNLCILRLSTFTIHTF